MKDCIISNSVSTFYSNLSYEFIMPFCYIPSLQIIIAQIEHFSLYLTVYLFILYPPRQNDKPEHANADISIHQNGLCVIIVSRLFREKICTLFFYTFYSKNEWCLLPVYIHMGNGQSKYHKIIGYKNTNNRILHTTATTQHNKQRKKKAHTLDTYELSQNVRKIITSTMLWKRPRQWQ